MLLEACSDGLVHGGLAGGLPGGVGVDLGDEGVPVLLVDAVALEGGELLDRGYGGFPGGVQPIHQRQQGLLGRARQGVGGDLFDVVAQVASADGGDALHLHVKRLGGVGVELDQFAAHEIVGHLGADGIHGGLGVVALVAEGGLEGFGILGCVLGAAFLLEHSHVFHHLGQRDVLLLQPKGLEDEACGVEHLLALVGVGLDVGEGDMVVPLEEVVEVAEHLLEPLGGGHDFVDADASVLVGVEHGEGLLVELEPLDRAAQHGPEFLVQLVEVGYVGSGLDVDACHTADHAELPLIATFGNKLVIL